MPLSRKPLILEPDPRSVRDARQWVGDILASLGREDLSYSAQLAVSELVTNAVLHASPPITVSVRGTREHPRVEVHDYSDLPPQVNDRHTGEDSLMSTVGRGIGIVACYSSTWGADLSGQGKTVWFEPLVEPDPEHGVPGDVFDLSEVVESRLAETAPPADLLTVRLLDMPVQVFAHFRSRYEELRRELRLLALAHGQDYPVAYEFSQLTLNVEQERRYAKGVDGLDEAVQAGRDRVDLEYHVPATAPTTMSRLLELLEKAEEFCRQEQMLAVAATPQQKALEHWYLGEFVRQGAGAEPIRWTGSFVVEAAGV
jgi:anti-sigma regulatory factor (Ser/Thr protein kinase)